MKKKSNISNAFWLIFLMFIHFQLLLTNTSDTTNNFKYKLGLLIGASSIDHSTHLPINMDNYNCGTFSDGSSFGKNVGLTLAYEYIPDFLYFDSKIIFLNFDASFSSTKSNFRVYNPINKEYEDVYLKYSFNSNVTTFSFQPSVFVQPFKIIPLRIRLSADISNPLSIPYYKTNEELVSPRIFTFPDQTQNHIIDNGTLNQLSTTFSAIGGLQFEHQLDNKFFLALEVFYQHPLNSAASNFKWESTQYGLNLILSYGFNNLFDIKEGKEEIPLPLDEPKEVKEIVAEEAIIKTEEVKLTIKPEPIEILETTVTEAYPILPYIFFGEKSSVIDRKYLVNKEKNINESNLPNNSIEIYYRLLDIIGQRLKNNKRAKITVVGHSDGVEFPTKSEREKLALSRANEVASYFMKNWQVNKNQIIIGSNDVPVLATSNIYSEGPSENRRVEIKTTDNQLLKPILLTKFKEYNVLADDIVLSLTSNNLDAVEISRFELINKEIIPLGKISDSIIKVKLNSEEKNNITKQIENSQTIPLYAQYNTNKTEIVNIPYVIRNDTFEYQRLNLIVFDFDKFEISTANLMILNDFVAKSIQDNSEVRIIGSTDILGSKDYNLQLSKQRAISTQTSLKNINPKANFIEVKGIGDTNLKYDNSTPEGRFYSRTVLIEVKTPINNK